MVKALRRPGMALVGIGALGVFGLVGLAGPLVAGALAPSAHAAVVAEDEAGGEPAPADPAPADPAPAPDPVADTGGDGGADPAAEDPAAGDPAAGDPAAEDPEPAQNAPAEDPADEDPTDEELDEDPSDEELDDELSDDELDDELDEELDDELDDELSDEELDDEFSDEELVDEELVEEELVEEELVDEELVEEELVEVPTGILSLDVEAGDGVQVRVSGDGLLPGSRVEVWVFSTPTLVTTGTADAAGSIALTATLPSSLAEGEHTVVLRGTDADGQPIEIGSGIELGPEGELLSVTPDADVSALEIPQLPTDPRAPPYPPVVALDTPATVVSTSIAAFALLSITGVGAAVAAGAGRSSGGGTGSVPAGAGRGSSGDVAGGGINEALGSGSLVFVPTDVAHNRGWRTPFAARGSARADHWRLFRLPLTSLVDEASVAWPAAVATKSPLLARIIGDGAPVRAMTGILSLLLPIAAVVLGIWSAISTGGIAEPPVIGVLIALIVIGVVDALAASIGVLVFTVLVAAVGGIVDWSSVRTLLGIALLVLGPSLIATSFRDIRRAVSRSFSAWWERVADLVIVPLVGAYTTYNIANALPPLGGSLFPVADYSALLAAIVAGMLVVNVLLEEAAARWFPERLSSVISQTDYPGTLQQVISAAVRLALFWFVSAAFIGAPWQLWVAGVIWILPSLLYLMSTRLPNLPKLWQSLPTDLPALGFALLVYLVLAGVLAGVYGDTSTFALMSFVILLIPDLILGVLWMFGRGPSDGDVRWYLRPSMISVYRIGGVAVLVVTTWLAVRSLF